MTGIIIFKSINTESNKIYNRKGKMRKEIGKENTALKIKNLKREENEEKYCLKWKIVIGEM